MARTRTRTREWPWPDAGEATLLGLIPDLHFDQFSANRRAVALADLIDGAPVPDLYVQIGDATENGVSGEDVAALAWLNALPADWITICGNHDLLGNPVLSGNGRTAAAWATAYGMPGQNFTRDVGTVRLIALGLDSDVSPHMLSAATLDFLDDELAAADRDCLVLCHVPLLNTVLGATSGADAQWSSAEGHFHIEPDAELRDVLAARPKAKAVFSGHTHSTTTTPGFVATETLGGRPFHFINTSALYYTGRDTGAAQQAAVQDPLRTVFAWCYPDRIELRVRDHGTRGAASIGTQRVTTLNL